MQILECSAHRDNRCYWCGGGFRMAERAVVIRINEYELVASDFWFHGLCSDEVKQLYDQWSEARKRARFTADFTVIDEGPARNGISAPK